MKVLWTHNFDPSVPNSGVFMHNAATALRDSGVEVEVLYLGNLRSLRGVQRAARQVRSRSEGFDILHAQYGSATALATATASGIPRVVTLRGSDWTRAHARVTWRKVHARAAGTMSRAALPRYDLVVCVSQRIAREVRAFRGSARTLVLPSPIDLDKFRPLPRAQALAAAGLPEDGTKYVLFTAMDSAAAHKRRDLAQAAVDYAASQMPRVRLLLASGVEHSEMPKRVALADAVLCTSTNEGWPNSVKEALACNVPYVATDVSDLKVIADRDPSCAIADPTPEALGEALIKVLRSPRPTHLREHLADMTMDESTRRLLAAYKRLLALG